MNGSPIERIAHWLQGAERAVVFTGAGMSTESGIPDFRSPGGVWSQNQPVYFDDFLASESSRYEYWRQKALSHHDFAAARPNAGHECLAAWQQAGRIEAVITQNIDGLHQDAGSEGVLELHGTARQVACLDCQARFAAGEMVELFLAKDAPPACPKCGGITKHATISFGQSLPEKDLATANELSRRSDLFLAMGSSLVVQPAAGLPLLAAQSGGRLVIVNREPTPLDDAAETVIHAAIGSTLSAIDELLT